MIELDPPVASRNVVFCADRRRADGSRKFWAVSAAADGSSRLQSWDEVDGAWTEQINLSEAATWVEVVVADPELVAVRSDETTAYITADPGRLLDYLVPAGDGEPDQSNWSAATDGEKFESDSEYSDGHILRWATINGEQLGFADSETRPVAFVGGSELSGGTPIAYFHWDNGWGCGNSELLRLRPGAAVATSWTESDGVVIKGFRFVESDAGLAAVRAEWEDFFSYFHIPQALEAAHAQALAHEYGIEASLEYFSTADRSEDRSS